MVSIYSITEDPLDDLMPRLMPRLLNEGRRRDFFDDMDDFMQYVLDRSVDPKDFPVEERICPACHEGYNTDGTAPEGMLELPCGHHIGVDCMLHWFSPAQANKNTCPMCRVAFFELQTPEDVDENEFEDGFEGGFASLRYEDEDEEPPYPMTFRQLLQPPRPKFGIAIGQIYSLLGRFEQFQERNIELIAEDVRQTWPDEEEAGAYHGPYLLVSAQVLHLFRIFASYLGLASLTTFSDIVNIMGRLKVRLQEPLAMMGTPWLWESQGPAQHLLADLNAHGLLQLGLLRLCEAERMWLDRQAERRAVRDGSEV